MNPKSRIVSQIITDDAYPIDVPGIKHYGARGLFLAERNDVVVLPTALAGFLRHMKANLARAGLQVPARIVFGNEMQVLADPEYHNLPLWAFRLTKSIVDARGGEDSDQLALVDEADHKNRFTKKAHELCGWEATPWTVCFDRRDQVMINMFSAPLVLKVAANSASGAGVHICADNTEFRVALDKVPADAPVQIQERLPQGTKWISAQFRTAGGVIKRLGGTINAFVGRTMHDGNDGYKIPEEAWQLAEAMVRYYVEQGYVLESMGIDLALLPDGRVLLIECGPRSTAPFYPLMFMERVKESLGLDLTEAWKLRNVYLHAGGCSPEGFEVFFEQVRHLAFDPETGRGYVIENWCVSEDGRLFKIGVAFFASSDAEARAMHAEFVQFVGNADTNAAVRQEQLAEAA